MTDSTPNSVDASIISFNAGIIISQPSRPKRFSDENFLAKKLSNLYKKSIQIQIYWYAIANHANESMLTL